MVLILTGAIEVQVSCLFSQGLGTNSRRASIACYLTHLILVLATEQHAHCGSLDALEKDIFAVPVFDGEQGLKNGAQRAQETAVDIELAAVSRANHAVVRNPAAVPGGMVGRGGDLGHGARTTR